MASVDVIDLLRAPALVTTHLRHLSSSPNLKAQFSTRMDNALRRVTLIALAGLAATLSKTNSLITRRISRLESSEKTRLKTLLVLKSTTWTVQLNLSSQRPHKESSQKALHVPLRKPTLQMALAPIRPPSMICRTNLDRRRSAKSVCKRPKELLDQVTISPSTTSLSLTRERLTSSIRRSVELSSFPRIMALALITQATTI